MKKIKLITILIFVILTNFSAFSEKEIICVVAQKNGDGSGGWQAVQYHCEVNDFYINHMLNCFLPGDLPCQWPTQGGISPCDGGTFRTNPIPSNLEIKFDNGSSIQIDSKAVNKLILDDINLNGNKKNFFIIDGKIGINYKLISKENELVLETRVLFGSTLEKYLTGGF